MKLEQAGLLAYGFHKNLIPFTVLDKEQIPHLCEHGGSGPTKVFTTEMEKKEVLPPSGTL